MTDTRSRSMHTKEAATSNFNELPNGIVKAHGVAPGDLRRVDAELIYAAVVTEDELVEAIRSSVRGRKVPVPAARGAIVETEAACGYRLPPLLARLLTEVANGGFGPRNDVYGVRGHDWYCSELFADMTEAAIAALDDPDWGRRRWCLPLIDWGCAIMTLIDCRDPAGALWGWDPNLCCLDHALFPLDQHLAQMLEESLTSHYPEPFYAGYFADLRRGAQGCAPLAWERGRVRPADAHDVPTRPSA